MRIGKAFASFCLLVWWCTAPSAAEDALTHFLKGEDQYRMNQYVQAVEEFKQAVALDGKLKGAYFYLGMSYKQLDRKTEAAEQFQKYATLADTNLPAERQLCIESLKELVRLQYDRGSYDDAYKTARKVVDLTGSPAQLSPPLTDIAAKAGHIDEIIAAGEKAVESTPKNPQVYWDLVRAYQAAGRKDDLLRLLQRAVQACPEEPGLHQSLAMEYGSRRDWVSAEKEYRAAIAARPEFYGPYEQLASLLLDAEKNKEAMETADQAIERAKKAGYDDSVLQRIERLRTRARAKLFTPEQLLQEYVEKVKTSPKDPSAHRRYADALEAANQFDDALEEQMVALRLDGNWTSLTQFENRLRGGKHNRELGRLWISSLALPPSGGNWNQERVAREFMNALKNGQLEGAALGDLDKQLKQTTNVSELHQLRSKIYEEIEKNLPGAIQEQSKSAELSPGQFEVRFHLGELLTQVNRHEEALAEFQKAKGINSKSSGACERMGDCLRQLGRLEEALKPYEEGSDLASHGEESNRLWGKINDLYRKLGRTDTLRARLEEKVKSEPNTPTPLAALGEFLWQQGDRPGATKALDKAMELAGPNGSMHVQVAKFYLSQADEEHAEAALLTGMKTAPKSFCVHQEAYDYYRKRNRHDRAFEICKTFDQTDMPWNKARWYDELLRCSYAAGQAKEAVAYLEDRVKKDSTDQAAREILPRARGLAGVPPGGTTDTPDASPGADQLKLWVSDVTTLTALSGPTTPGFNVSRQREVQVGLYPAGAVKGALRVTGIRMGGTQPPAKVQSDEKTGSIATWDLSALPAGERGVQMVSAKTPAVTEACSVEGLLVDRQVEPLGAGRYRCVVKVKCPHAVVVYLRKVSGAEIDENTFDPPVKTLGSLFLPGQTDAAMQPLDCRKERSFAFTVRTDLKQYLPYVELGQVVKMEPKVLRTPEQGLSLESNGITITLTDPVDVHADNLTAVARWRLVVPEQTGM